MAKLTMTFDTPETKKFMVALNKIPKRVPRVFGKAIKEALEDVKVKAQTDHRFTSRSNNLERSVQVDVKPSGLEGKVFLDTGLAVYGPYIHNGTYSYGPHKQAGKNGGRGWKPDRFLTKQFNKAKPAIRIKLDRAMGQLLKEAGF